MSPFWKKQLEDINFPNLMIFIVVITLAVILFKEVPKSRVWVLGVIAFFIFLGQVKM
jgi:hypothetical protein